MKDSAMLRLIIQEAPNEYISVTDVICGNDLQEGWPGLQYARYYPAQIIAHGNAQFKSSNHQEVYIYSLHCEE
jgi:hypothetical protein